MKRRGFGLQHALLIVILIMFVVGFNGPSDRPLAAPNSPPCGPATFAGSQDASDWKRQAFGELEFLRVNDRNVFEARLRKSRPESSVAFSLGTRFIIPVLSILKDDALKSREGLAVLRAAGKFSVVSETGRVVANLEAAGISSGTVNRARELIRGGALRAEHKIDEGMYEGVVFVFPVACLPFRTVAEVKSRFRGLLIELILDKIKRMTGRGRESAETRFHASIVAESQTILFFPEFPLFIAEDKKGSLNVLKAMEFMIDPVAAQRATENAEYLALHHEGQAGRVIAIQSRKDGLRIVIQTTVGDVEYTSLVATDVKMGDIVEPNQLIGIIQNPRRARQ